MGITSWAGFPIYKINFGGGDPIRFRVPAKNFETLSIIFPEKSGDGLELLIGFDKTAMESFGSDEIVRKYLKPVGF